jgi:hypothetical protein
VFASIPPPPITSLPVGPLRLTIFGLVVAIAVLVGASVTRRRYERAGGDPELVDRVLFPAILVEFVGARFAPVATNTGRFQGRWLEVLAVWQGRSGAVRWAHVRHADRDLAGTPLPWRPRPVRGGAARLFLGYLVADGLGRLALELLAERHHLPPTGPLPQRLGRGWPGARRHRRTRPAASAGGPRW